MANDGFPPTRPDGTNHGISKNTPTHPPNVKATTETMVRAAQMRAAGATFREIGLALSIDWTWARTLLLRALEAAQYEAADLMRVQERQRLDSLQRSWWTKALRTGEPDSDNYRPPDTKAAAVVLRIMDRRAKLFGLDAPVQVDISTDVDRQLRELEAAFPPVTITATAEEPNGDNPVA